MISLIRWLLLPFSFLYQSIIWTRNRLYDKNILKSKSFEIPTIVIGNLAVGGTGKTPLTEYLIQLLAKNYKVATLSRGYGRQTKGFRYVNIDAKAQEVGDEPLQFKTKFPQITVAVSEDRCLGIEQLKNNNDLILLDDAFQHRKLDAGYNILLLEYHSLFKPTILLPTGDFRDTFSSMKRAQLILITKCPEIVTSANKQKIEHKIRTHTPVPIFYTQIAYDIPKTKAGELFTSSLLDVDIVLFCGIAKPQPLVDYLNSNAKSVIPITFPDHHNFSPSDFKKIKDSYDRLISPNKIILTTEKDMQRLEDSTFSNYPLYYLPIALKSLDHQQDTFDHFIESYLNAAFNVNKH